MTAAEAPEAGLAAAVFAATRRQTVRLAVLAGAVNLLLPAGACAYAWIIEKPYWKMFRGEETAVAWFSSVQLLLIALVAYANHLTAARIRKLGGSAGRPWIWPVFAAGFVVLALDERFDIHEALRDRVFLPARWFVDIPYLAPGDVGLYVFFGVGLVFAALLVGALRRWPPAATLFGSALALTLAVVVIDSLEDEVLEGVRFAEFWDYAFEEVGELWAQLLFLLAFLVVLRGRLAELSGLSPRDEAAAP